LVAILLVFLSFGTAMLVYAVLWLVVPPAKTAAEKLQMRGEPVTLATLKDEAQNATTMIQERSKPFVIVLRLLLGLGFVLAALGAMALVLLAIFVREPLFGASIHDLATSDMLAVVGGAYVAAIVAGLLFVVLMALAAYASFTWAMNRRLVVASIVIVVLGLVSFATAIGLGVYGSHQVNQHIEQSRTTETVTLSQLDTSIKRLVVTNTGVPVEYHVTTGKPLVEIHYLQGQKKPELTAMRSGDTVNLAAQFDGACKSIVLDACNGYDLVVIYGPALDSLDLASGSVTYVATQQSALAVTTQPNTSLTLNGVIDTLTATVGDDSTLAADAAAVTTGTVTVGRDSSSTFGVLSHLTLSTPGSCAADSQATVSVKRVTYLKEADYVTQQSEIHENCTTINIDEPSPAVLN